MNPKSVAWLSALTYQLEQIKDRLDCHTCVEIHLYVKQLIVFFNGWGHVMLIKGEATVRWIPKV